MQYTTEQAHLLGAFALGDYTHERPITERVIAAIPASQEGYTPDDKSMCALKLAWHLASSEWWFLSGVLAGEYKSGGGAMPDEIKSAQDVINWYNATVPPVLEKAKAMSGDAMNKTIDFFGMMQAPAFMYIQLMIKHSAHHRGQLSAYLRPMGAKVPGIYGPSGDSK